MGVLRNISARHFYWYAALFEVAYFEQARPAVAAYDGNLEEGRTYRAKASRNPRGELVLYRVMAPRSPAVPLHHAGRIGWTDAKVVAGSRPFPKNCLLAV